MKTGPSDAPIHVGLLLLPSYTMLAFSNAIEPLRLANYVSGKQLYRWSILTLDGQPVAASNEALIMPTAAVEDAEPLDMLLVCGGLGYREACNEQTINYVRKLAHEKVPLGGLCTGAFTLAKAGLLDGYRCTLHWEYLASAREEFPRVIFSSELFVIDRDRYTASGGIAPMDMMLNIIKQQKGEALAVAIAEEFMVERIRLPSDKQRIPLLTLVGANQDKIIEAASLMEANVEEPLNIDEISGYVGLSQRQLERLFKKHLGRRPAQYYLELRLNRARQLLLNTSLSIMDITLSCGFQSAPHFSKCYRDLFGYPPSAERRGAED